MVENNSEPPPRVSTASMHSAEGCVVDDDGAFDVDDCEPASQSHTSRGESSVSRPADTDRVGYSSKAIDAASSSTDTARYVHPLGSGFGYKMHVKAEASSQMHYDSDVMGSDDEELDEEEHDDTADPESEDHSQLHGDLTESSVAPNTKEILEGWQERAYHFPCPFSGRKTPLFGDSEVSKAELDIICKLSELPAEEPLYLLISRFITTIQRQNEMLSSIKEAEARLAAEEQKLGDRRVSIFSKTGSQHLQNVLDESKEKNEEIQSLSKKYDEALADSADAVIEIERLENVVHELEDAVRSGRKLEEEATVVANERRDEAARLLSLQKTKDAAIDALEAEVAGLRAELSKASQQPPGSENAQPQQAASVSPTRSVPCADKSSTNAAHEDQVNNPTDSANKRERDIEDLERVLDEHKRKIEEYEAMLEERNCEIENLSHQVEDLESNIDLTGAIEGGEEDFKIRQELDLLRDRNAELESENDGLKRHVETIASAMPSEAEPDISTGEGEVEAGNDSEPIEGIPAASSGSMGVPARTCSESTPGQPSEAGRRSSVLSSTSLRSKEKMRDLEEALRNVSARLSAANLRNDTLNSEREKLVSEVCSLRSLQESYRQKLDRARKKEETTSALHKGLQERHAVDMERYEELENEFRKFVANCSSTRPRDGEAYGDVFSTCNPRDANALDDVRAAVNGIQGCDGDESNRSDTAYAKDVSASEAHRATAEERDEAVRNAKVLEETLAQLKKTAWSLPALSELGQLLNEYLQVAGETGAVTKDVQGSNSPAPPGRLSKEYGSELERQKVLNENLTCAMQEMREMYESMAHELTKETEHRISLAHHNAAAKQALAASEAEVKALKSDQAREISLMESRLKYAGFGTGARSDSFAPSDIGSPSIALSRSSLPISDLASPLGERGLPANGDVNNLIEAAHRSLTTLIESHEQLANRHKTAKDALAEMLEKASKAGKPAPQNSVASDAENMEELMSEFQAGLSQVQAFLELLRDCTPVAQQEDRTDHFAQENIPPYGTTAMDAASEVRHGSPREALSETSSARNNIQDDSSQKKTPGRRASAQVGHSMLEKQAADWRTKWDDETAKNGKLMKQIVMLTNELADADTMKKKLQTDLEEWMNDLEDLTRKIGIEASMSALGRFIDDAMDLADQNASLEESCKELMTELSSASAELDESKDKRKQLEAKLEKAEIRNSNLIGVKSTLVSIVGVYRGGYGLDLAPPPAQDSAERLGWCKKLIINRARFIARLSRKTPDGLAKQAGTLYHDHFDVRLTDSAIVARRLECSVSLQDAASAIRRVADLEEKLRTRDIEIGRLHDGLKAIRSTSPHSAPSKSQSADVESALSAAHAQERKLWEADLVTKLQECLQAKSAISERAAKEEKHRLAAEARLKKYAAKLKEYKSRLLKIQNDAAARERAYKEAIIQLRQRSDQAIRDSGDHRRDGSDGHGDDDTHDSVSLLREADSILDRVRIHQTHSSLGIQKQRTAREVVQEADAIVVQSLQAAREEYGLQPENGALKSQTKQYIDGLEKWRRNAGALSAESGNQRLRDTTSQRGTSTQVAMNSATS